MNLNGDSSDAHAASCAREREPGAGEWAALQWVAGALPQRRGAGRTPSAAHAMAARGGKPKDAVLDIQKWIEQPVRVKFTGGREVTGTLQGFDALVNLVLDDTVEYLRDPADPYKLTDKTRHLGLIVCRGPSVSIISPVDGTEEIANPFGAPEDEAAI